MTGSIVTRTLRDGTKVYKAVFRALDGKQKWRTFTRRKAAERFLAGAVKAVHEGSYQDVVPTLMGEVFDGWLTSLDTRQKQGLLKASTATSYASMVRLHLRPAFEAVRSDRLRPSVIAEWSAKLADDIAGERLSAKTYNNLVNLLSAVLKWARHPAQSYLAHDALIGLKRLPKSKVERPCLQPAEIPLLLTAAADVRDSTILAVAAYSGLRRGELFGLQWGDIDYCRARISVNRSIYQNVITSPKTATSIRVVDVPESLLVTLAIYQSVYPSIGQGFVFRTEAGAALDGDNWNHRCYAAIIKRAVADGLQPIGLHGLRHGYASLLIAQGEPLKYVSAQLGHASITITADTYGHLFRESSTAAMGRLDARIAATAKPGSNVIPMPRRTGTEG